MRPIKFRPEAYRQLAASLLLWSACAPLAAGAQQRYSVDHMLAVEAIGKVRFTPDGRSLLFEREGSFEAQPDFSRARLDGEHSARILRFDLTTGQPAAPLFPQSNDHGYTIQGISPDGAYLLFGEASPQGVASGVVALAGGAPRTIDVAPDSPGPFAPSWLKGARVVVEGLPAGQVAAVAALESEWLRDTARQWDRRNAGRTATAVAIGSGRFATPPRSGGQLVVADAASGRTAPLAKGDFTVWRASPDGKFVAALREVPLAIDPDALIEHGANIGAVERRLIIINTDSGQAVEPCAGCDVLLSPLDWSPSSKRLAFVARDAGRAWPDARYRTFDTRSRKETAIDTSRLQPVRDRQDGARLDMRSAWVGDVLAIPSAGKDRVDWHGLADGVSVALTASFAGKAPELAAIHRGRLVFLHDGVPWFVDRNGQRTRVSPDALPHLALWRDPAAAALDEPIPDIERHLVAQATPRSPADPARLVIVDLTTGRHEILTAPSATGRFVAVSPERSKAAVLDTNDNVTTLSVMDARGARPVATVNTHLKGVVGGTPVRIDHKGPSGDPRISWLLLPPSYRPGTRVPTIVSVYPGTIGRPAFTTWRLDQVHALNGHIMAARGYAVLYPSLPVDYAAVPRDPLRGLAAEVLSAVDAAIAAGAVDPDRLAVHGQSYGGYAATGIIGQTGRFKSAIAMAGVYDLISYYGQFDVRYSPVLDRFGLNLFAVSHLETSQGGMGAAPWADPQRYLRNSPLMNVQRITTPLMLVTGDRDYVSTTQAEEMFTALTRLNKDARFVRYFGEGHVIHSPANIRDLWHKTFDWLERTLGAPRGN